MIGRNDSGATKPDEVKELSGIGGNWSEWWNLGTERGDKGQPFHRPDGFGRLHSNVPAPHYWEVYVNSPRFRTAEGIGPGSTVADIRSRYPEAKVGAPTDAAIHATDVPQFWPFYGQVEFYDDLTRGIGFAVRKSDGVCIEVAVLDPGDADHQGFIWYPPVTAKDYQLTINTDTGYVQVGEAAIGMSLPQVEAILGQADMPPPPRTATRASWLWWRVPGQERGEPPALGMCLQKLANGDQVVVAMQVTSPLFAFGERVANTTYPGCSLQDIQHQRNGLGLTTLNLAADDKFKYYGDTGNENCLLLYKVRLADSMCVAINMQMLIGFGAEAAASPP